MSKKRLIDANVPIRDLTAMKSMYDAIALDGIIKALKEAPTVDAVEAVRCKDCRRWSHIPGLDEEPRCSLFCGLHSKAYATKPDDFCSYGERREGE